MVELDFKNICSSSRGIDSMFVSVALLRNLLIRT